MVTNGWRLEKKIKDISNSLDFLFVSIDGNKEVWVILKKMGMRHAKPYPHDRRRPKDAEDALKKT